MENSTNIETKSHGRKEVPIEQKVFLTVEEAAALFNIGQTKIRELTEDDRSPYVLYCGVKRLIKRQKFQEYLEKQYSI